MDIPGALSSISTALTIVKQLNEIDARVDEATFKLKIAEITSSLADTKIRLVEAAEEISEKEAEIKSLKLAMSFKAESTTRLKGFTYECNEDGTPKGAPFCPACESNGTMLRLVHYISERGMPWKCAKCKSDYQNVGTYAE